MQNLVQIITNSPKGNVNNLANTKGDSNIENLSNLDNPKGFVSILFEQIKDKSQKIDSKTKSLDKNEFLTKIETDSTPKSTDQLLLNEVLNILNTLEMANGSEEKLSFPKFSDKMQSILNNQNAVNDLKSIKSMDDILKFSEKYNLNLEKITITEEKIDSIKSNFPNLEKNGFFEIENNPKLSEKIESFKFNNTKLNDESKNIRAENINQMLKNLTKDGSITQKDTSSKDLLQNLLKNVDESNQKVIVKDIEKDKKDKVKDFIQKNEKSDTSQQENRNISIKDNEKLQQTMKKENLTNDEIQNDSKNNFENISIKNSEKKSLDNQTISIISKDEKIQKLKENEQKIDNKNEIRKSNLDNNLDIETEKQNKFSKIADIEISQNKKNHQNSNQTNLTSSQILTQKNEENLGESKENHNETKIENSSSKIEIKNNQKSEFQIKSSQNLTYKDTFDNFANDLKQKLEQYKPPIMKVQMALNPKNLGEVEVTILNRGNNLHVNITSNTNTMTLFTQNQTEFKNSLVNMGFTNLEMNFSDQRESNKEQQKGNSSKKIFNEELEQDNSETASINLVVPRYI